jgi:hypothetical protein
MARGDWSGSHAGDFTISMDQQMVASKTLREKDPLERWQQVEVDLSPWSGRAVTLSLQLHAAQPDAPVEILIADAVVDASVPDNRKTAAEPDTLPLFDEATRARPVTVKFSPGAIRAGESYIMSLPQPSGKSKALALDGAAQSGEWAGQWVDMLVACGNHAPVEVRHFRQLDSQGQVRVAVDRGFQPCEWNVRGVRRSGDPRWKFATGSVIVTAAATVPGRPGN